MGQALNTSVLKQIRDAGWTGSLYESFRLDAMLAGGWLTLPGELVTIESFTASRGAGAV